MYYLIPVGKNQTVLYIVSGKKMLFNMTKRETHLLIDKFLKNKLPKKHVLFSLLATSLNKNDNTNANIRTSKSNINFILDERVRTDTIVDYKKFDDFISQNNDNIRRKRNNYLLVGLIFDDTFLNKIEKNRALLENKWCLLIGLEDFYLFKLGHGVCPKCLQMRRLTNLYNVRENIILEKYFNKNQTKFEIDQHYFIILNKFKFNKYSNDHVFIYNRKQNKLLKTRLIPFPGCSVCVSKYPTKISKNDYINEHVGLSKPISTYVQKIGNLKFFISSTSISRINVISFLKFNRQSIRPYREINYNIKNSKEFSLFRPIICGGVSFFNKKMSEVKAFGESLERYCAAYLDEKKIIKNNTYIFSKEKDCPWVLYDNRQYTFPDFSFKKLSRKSNIYYVRGDSLINDMPRFIPASFVYIRYPLSISDIGIYPTTGLTCGKNLNRIRIDGICENIERDACMLTWLLRISPKKIININNNEILRILKNFKIEGIDIYLFELSIDLKLPVILALGVNKKHAYPRIFVGSSCKPNKDAAIIKAMEELTQGFSWKHLVEKYKNYDFGKNFENITHFEHHALFYATLKNMDILNFIFKTERTVDYKDIHTGFKYRNVIDIFKSKFDIIELDLTTSDVRRLGYIVKKIMIPGLQPLNSNHKLCFLDKRRINSIVKYLREKGIKYEKKLNLFPHPFP